MEFIFSTIAFIIALSLLITVHEFGHYLVARRCGVHVERFSIGFGKVLFTKTNKHCTEFVFSIIPFGGYIKMMDEQNNNVINEKRHMTFNNKTIYQKIAIVSAGPIANFLLAIIVYWIVYIFGLPSSKLIIENIKPNSIAEYANLTPKMELLSINNIEMHDWDSVKKILTKKNNNKFNIKVLSQEHNKPIIKIIDLTKTNFNSKKEDIISYIGIIPISIKFDYIIKKVIPGSAGERAGLMINDKIININGKSLDDLNMISNIIYNNPDVSLNLDINRDNKLISIKLTPDYKKDQNIKKIGFAGIEISVFPLINKYKEKRQYNIFNSFYKSIIKTYELIKLTINTIYKIFTGHIKLNTLNGPLSIAKEAKASAGLGVIYYLMFIAIISINLGIINLFPISILDGGHLLFLIIEKIKGSPVSEQTQNISFQISIIILVLLTGISLFNDFSRI